MGLSYLLPPALQSIHIGINAHVTDAGRTTSEHRATQLLICESLSFAIDDENCSLSHLLPPALQCGVICQDQYVCVK